VLLLAPPGPAFGHLVTVARRLRIKRAETAIFSSEPEALRLARMPVRIAPRTAGMLAPLVYGVAVQLLAYHLSRAKGINPDRPRGLRKVTRTF
jgi:glutamine---fructose-6-phosphate transaminase (isomerizing)